MKEGREERAYTASLCPRIHCTEVVDERDRVMTAVLDNNRWLCASMQVLLYHVFSCVHFVVLHAHTLCLHIKYTAYTHDLSYDWRLISLRGIMGRRSYPACLRDRTFGKVSACVLLFECVCVCLCALYAFASWE